MGAHIWRGAPNIFLSCRLLFGSTSTILRFGEHFGDGQYNFVSLLFAVILLTVPPYPAICKSMGHVLPVPYGVGATAVISYNTGIQSFQKLFTPLSNGP